MRSRFPYQLAVALDHELEGLDRSFRSDSIPEGLDIQRVQMLLERSREQARQADDRIARGRSLQHGSALMNAVAHGKHPVIAYEEGRRETGAAMSDEFAIRRRTRYLEQVLPRLREAERAKEAPPVKE